MPEHTPGSWEAEGEIVWAEGRRLATMGSGTIAENEANARLMAAGPEMLEALGRAHNYMSEWLRPTNPIMEAVLQAIAKAKGA